MSTRHHERGFPRTVLAASAALVALTIMGALLARGTGVGTTLMPEGTRLEVRDLRFEDRPDGGIAAYLPHAGRAVYVIAPGGDGFVRGVLRGLARERKRRGLARTLPYRLERWADGRLTITDPSTGRGADLGAFGPANYGAFRQLFDATASTAGVAASATLAAAPPGAGPQ
jgi:putative photosynthetic complex assembly protein